MSDDTETKTDSVAFTSLEDLQLEDVCTVPVRMANDQVVRFKGSTLPWTLALNRFSVPHVLETFKRHAKMHDDGIMTDEEFEFKILDLLVVTWENGPEPFSKSGLKKLCNDPKLKWFSNFVSKIAFADKNFMKRT